jgi:tetratricopeptide (TPR) repeat protein
MMVYPRLMSVAALLVPFLASPVRATEQETQERAARKACLSGDFAKGVEILSDLYIDTRDATHIFNQGRCFEQNNRYEEAIARFREYLRKASRTSPADRAETEKHIADCQALLSQAPTPSALAAGSADGPPVAPTVPVASAVVPVEQRTPIDTVVQARNPGRGLRIAGVVCGLAGLASVGTGIYYYTRARSYSDKVSSTPNPNPADQQAGKDAETMQWVFYSLGAAGLLGGAGLYLWGWHSAAEKPTSTAIAPMVGPGMAGLMALGAF